MQSYTNEIVYKWPYKVFNLTSGPKEHFNLGLHITQNQYKTLGEGQTERISG